MTHSYRILLLVTLLVCTGNAAAECELPVTPACDRNGAKHAVASGECGIDERARAALLAGLGQDAAEGDAFEISASTREAPSIAASDRVCVAATVAGGDATMARVDFEIHPAKGSSKRYAYWMRVERSGWYWETVNAVPAGTAIAATDVTRRYGSVRAHPRPVVENWPEGLRATAAVGAGAVLAQSDVEPIPLVAVGDPVELQVASGSIRLALKAISMTDAASGDVARLTLEHNGERTYAILLDQKTAVPCRLPLRDRLDDCSR